MGDCLCFLIETNRQKDIIWLCLHLCAPAASAANQKHAPAHPPTGSAATVELTFTMTKPNQLCHFSWTLRLQLIIHTNIDTAT